MRRYFALVTIMALELRMGSVCVVMFAMNL